MAIAVACSAPQAQPVRLRLAASLCTSMTSQVLAGQNVPPVSSAASADASVNDALARRLEEQRGTYFQRLDALVPFSGLYAVGQADRSFQDNIGSRYTVGLEYELFKEGRAEARRQVDRQKVESKAQYLQVLRDVEDRQLQENLLAVGQMRNRLLAVLYDREAGAIRPVLERRKLELAAGRATRSDVAEVEYKAERAALYGRHYRAARDVVVYPQSQALINRIEALELRPEAELVARAVERSPDHQLQALLAERSSFLPAVRDNTSLRLYLERNKDFDRGPYNTAGVRLRVPIGSDRSRDELADHTRELFEAQQGSIRAALAQRVALLAERLRLKQNDMRLLQAENRMVRQKADLACYRLDHPVASLPGDADRDVEELTLRLHELQREILVARLDVLEVLTQVSALVKPRDPSELYSMP